MRSPLDPRYVEGMSNLYKGIKKAAAQGLFSPTDVKRNFDQYKRVVRVLFSQGDNFIIPFLEGRDPKTLSDPQVAKKLSTEVFGKLSKEPAQQAMNYAPNIIEGHHPVSVESIFQAGKHLIDQGRWDDFFEYQRYLNNEYGVGGTVAESMYPLTKFAHQWKGSGTVDKYGNPKKPSPIPSAHTTPNPWTLAESEGFPVEMTWGKEYDYSGINDPRKLGDVFMQQSGFPQYMMADKAMDSPQEMGFRTELAERLGIRERDLYTLIKKRSDSSSAREFDFNAPGARIKQLLENAGITKDDVVEMAHRAYGLPVPEPRTALPSDPNAPKVPRAKKDKVVPTFEDAKRLAKGWFAPEDFSLPSPGQNIGGYLPIPVPSMEDLKQNALGMGIGAATEAITPESAYAAGKGDWRTAATKAAQSIGTGAIVGGVAQTALTNLMPKAAAALASGPAMPYVAAVSTGLALQDAAQAYRAGQAGRSIPLQQKIEQTEQGKRRQQDVAQFRAAMPGVASKNRMQADLSGRLSPQQIESFRAGGGNAAMMRDGLSVQQIIERGSSLRLRKVLEGTIRKEGDV